MPPSAESGCLRRDIFEPAAIRVFLPLCRLPAAV